MDAARKKANKELEGIEKRIRREYESAKDDMTQKWLGYMERAEERIASAQRKYDAISSDKTASLDDIKKARKDLESIKTSVTLRDERYRAVVDGFTDRLANVNSIAISYANDSIPSLYTIGYNQAGNDMQAIGMSFTLYNEDVVKNLMKQGDVKFPAKKLDIPKDKRWNTKQINSAVLQGILQGESMDKIANRIYPIVDRNANAAIRSARTLVTGVENKGRLDSYRRMEESGVVLKKVWMATPDGRTRDLHLSMDGQEVDISEPFVDGDGNELDYPGDPSAAPESVYNCRCSMITHIIGFTSPTTGELTEVDYDGIDRQTMHEAQIDAEREERRGADTVAGSGVGSGQSYRAFASGEDANKYFGQRPEISLRRENREEYDRMREEYENSPYYKWRDGLTGEQAASIGAYSGDAYSGINGLLRHEMTEKMVDAWNETEQISIQDMISNITGAIDAFELNDGIKVYRTCENDVLRNLNLEVGSMFHDDGFGSTSTLSQKVASGDIVMEINVPPGKGRGAWINPLSGAQDEEYEFLLQRGSDYRVRAISKVGEDTVVELDLVGNTIHDYSYATKEEVIKLWKENGTYDEFNAKRI